MAAQADVFQLARQHLMKLAGFAPDGQRYGTPNPAAFALRNNAQYTPYGEKRPPSSISNTFGVQYGVAPTDADVWAFLKSTGYQPPAAGAQAPAGNAAASSSAMTWQNPATSGQAGMNSQQRLLLAMLGQDWQDQQNANRANDARYDYDLGEYDALRSRNQERVQNWGHAAETDLDERFHDELGNQNASLAARGLTNSTIVDAFRERSARDNAREHQRVSEMRDDRASRYDTADTGNLLNFVERRTDQAGGMDNGQLLQFANAFGAAGIPQGESPELAATRKQIADLQAQLGQRQPLTSAPLRGAQGRGPIFLNAADMYGFGGGGLMQPAAGGQQPAMAQRTAQGPSDATLKRIAQQYQDKQNRIAGRRLQQQYLPPTTPSYGWYNPNRQYA